MDFSWDPNKSESNEKKHGINFIIAAEVFKDENAILDQGSTINGEERYITVGKTMKLILIAVVFTLRNKTIRIISARQARKNEIKAYLSNALKNEADVE